MNTPLNVALIGAGTIGRLHAKHLAHAVEGARLAYVADVLPDAARRCAESVGAHWTTDYREAIEDRATDAVVVASATGTHPDIVEAAARAGKHVFCEKPLARTLAETDRALKAVEDAGVKFQIGFQRRFDPNFLRVKHAIVAGEIGTPHIAHLVSRDPEPPMAVANELGGGTFFDMSIHDFDMARFLMDREPVEVYTYADVMLVPGLQEFGDVDVAVMMFRFEGGGVVTVDNYTKATYGYDQRAEVIGSQGSISIDNNYPHSAVLSDARGLHYPKPLYYFLERYEQVYRHELQVFVDCVRERRDPPVGAAAARMSVIMALAAKKSHEEKRPVKISEIG